MFHSHIIVWFMINSIMFSNLFNMSIFGYQWNHLKHVGIILINLFIEVRIISLYCNVNWNHMGAVKHISIHIFIVNMDKDNSTLRFYPFRWQLLNKSFAHPKALWWKISLGFLLNKMRLNLHIEVWRTNNNIYLFLFLFPISFYLCYPFTKN